MSTNGFKSLKYNADFVDMMNVEQVIFKEEFYSGADDDVHANTIPNLFKRKSLQSASLEYEKRNNLAVKNKLMSATDYGFKKH